MRFEEKLELEIYFVLSIDWIDQNNLVVIVNVVLWIGRKREGFDERSREGRMMARGLLFLTVVRYIYQFLLIYC